MCGAGGPTTHANTVTERLPLRFPVWRLGCGQKGRHRTGFRTNRYAGKQPLRLAARVDGCVFVFLSFGRHTHTQKQCIWRMGLQLNVKKLTYFGCIVRSLESEYSRVNIYACVLHSRGGSWNDRNVHTTQRHRDGVQILCLFNKCTKDYIKRNIPSYCFCTFSSLNK